jgi:hypothetical protein
MDGVTYVRLIIMDVATAGPSSPKAAQTAERLKIYHACTMTPSAGLQADMQWPHPMDGVTLCT